MTDEDKIKELLKKPAITRGFLCPHCNLYYYMRFVEKSQEYVDNITEQKCPECGEIFKIG